MVEPKQKVTFKEKYDLICCVCGAELRAKPSISMKMHDINSGHGGCTKCKAFLHLEISPNLAGEEMFCMPWGEYMMRQRLKSK